MRSKAEMVQIVDQLRETCRSIMKKKDFESLDKMIEFINRDLRHCIGVDANWIVALALSAYTEAFGHFLPRLQNAKNFQCYNEFLDKWMNYGHLIDSKKPHVLYDDIRNGLAHEYLLKTDADVNMGTGICGIEVLKKNKKRFIRFNIITYNDFMKATIRTDNNLKGAFDSRMKGKRRLK
jgi:hypothetical protein